MQSCQSCHHQTAVPLDDQLRDVLDNGLFSGLLHGTQEQIRLKTAAVSLAVESELVRAVLVVVQISVRPNKPSKRLAISIKSLDYS